MTMIRVYGCQFSCCQHIFNLLLIWSWPISKNSHCGYILAAVEIVYVRWNIGGFFLKYWWKSFQLFLKIKVTSLHCLCPLIAFTIASTDINDECKLNHGMSLKSITFLEYVMAQCFYREDHFLLAIANILCWFCCCPLMITLWSNALFRFSGDRFSSETF